MTRLLRHSGRTARDSASKAWVIEKQNHISRDLFQQQVHHQCFKLTQPQLQTLDSASANNASFISFGLPFLISDEKAKQKKKSRYPISVQTLATFPFSGKIASSLHHKHLYGLLIWDIGGN